MKKALAIMLMFAIASIGPFGEAVALTFHAATAPQDQDDDWQVEFSPDQLENLLAPIALYPDPLLAQVLLAATFPDQIDEAARTMRAYGQNYNVDGTDWDVSVKAVAHYPTVLSMMADKIDWTVSVGQAYVNQSADVMDAIQRLRARAESMGNLVSTSQQEIVETDGDIYIYPAQPNYIYVPVYDPAIVYFRRPTLYAAPLIWFGAGLIIGAWLNHDCDWHGHRVFYHGWDRGGPSWILRSRPHVRINNIYVNNNYRNVVINRGVINHRVNYGALNRYNNIHRDTNYDNVRRQRGGAGNRYNPPPGPPRSDNKIIRRNIDPRDPRIDANRGHDRQPGGQPEATRPPSGMRPPEGPRPITPAPQTPPSGMRPPETPRPVTPREVPRPPQTRQPEQIRPMPQPQVQQPSVFRGGGGAFDPRAAGQRGQESRQQPVAPPRPAPPPPQARPAPPPAAARPAPPPAAPTQRTAPPPRGQDRGHDRRPQ